MVALGFAAGAGSRLVLRNPTTSASAADAAVEGTATAASDEILRLLAAEYYLDTAGMALDDAAVEDLPRLLDDPYTHFMTKAEYDRYMAAESATSVGVGIDVVERPHGMLVTGIFPGSPAEQGWMLAGDVITAIDGIDLTGASLHDALALLKGPADTAVALQVDRNGVPLDLMVTRRMTGAWFVAAELRSVDERLVGYVALYDFSDGAAAQVEQAVRSLLAAGATELVLDLRGNPGGWAREAVGVASIFLAENTPVLVERSVHFDDTTYRTHGSPVTVDVPLAVLVDSDSASSAEIVAGALRDAGRAVLIGETTYGKGRIQDIAVLQSGGAFKYTIAEYVTPSGYALDRVGLPPDVWVGVPRSAVGDPAFTQAAQVLDG